MLEHEIVVAASEAYRAYRRWRTAKNRHDRDCEREGPTPTGGDIVMEALGIPLDGRGTPEQEHLWALLVSWAIDYEDDRAQKQPPRMREKH